MTQGIDISSLSPAECILLAEELWQRARSHPDALALTPAQQEELHRRLDALESGAIRPGESWEAVRQRLWGR